MDLLALEKQFWFILFPRLLPFHFYSQKQCPWLVQETDPKDKIEHQQEAESLPALWPSGARRTVWAPHFPRVQVLPEDIGMYQGAGEKLPCDSSESKQRNSTGRPPHPREDPSGLVGFPVRLCVGGQVRAHCWAVFLLLHSPLHPPSPPSPPHPSFRW